MELGAVPAGEQISRLIISTNCQSFNIYLFSHFKSNWVKFEKDSDFDNRLSSKNITNNKASGVDINTHHISKVEREKGKVYKALETLRAMNY